MSAKRCRFGKLKHPRGRRVCKKARSSKRARSTKRRGRKSYRKAAGFGVGLLGLMGVAGVGTVMYLKSINA